MPGTHFGKKAFLALAWTLLIALACFTPGDQLPEYTLFSYDKIGHFALFGGLTFLWLWALHPKPKGLPWMSILFLSILCVIYSGLIEVIQETWISGRFGSWADFVADIFGCAMGAYAYRLWGLGYKYPPASK